MTDTNHKDTLIRATAAGGTIRAFAVSAKNTVEEARSRHDTSPVVTAALGRLLAGAAMMSMMEKDEDDLLTLQVIGDGPIGGITVTASGGGILKGFANHTNVDIPLKAKGKLDVGTAVGPGILRVMRDTGAPEPYVGTVQLVSGEIAEDLTYYFAQSEQTPSAVGLGVLVDTDRTVKAAGGFIVQLMPDAKDDTVSQLEKNIQAIPPVTEMFDKGLSPEEVLNEVLNGMELSVLEKKEVSFTCTCGRDRISHSLSTIAPEDLDEMIHAGKDTEVRCQFCNETYTFTPAELEAIRSEANVHRKNDEK